MSDVDVVTRRATLADASVIAWHRARMFADMGALPAELEEQLQRVTFDFLVAAIPRGEYVGWLISPANEPDRVLAGAGVQLRRVSPHPRNISRDTVVVAEGRHGLVVNVYTDPEWRGRGLATRLMRDIVAWADTEQLDRVVLHAADAARPMYERLGFSATNEMQYSRLSLEGS